MSGSDEPEAPPVEQEPLVSVIIPAYNSARFIAETIESVRTQTYSNWELIVVDDGSKDETVAVVRASEIPAEQLRVLQVANGGAGAARQHGLQHARGDLIALLDHDDVWLPHKLAAQVPVILSGPIDVVVSDWYRLGFGYGNEARLRLDERVYSGSEMFKLLWDYNRFPPSPMLVTKAALTAAGWFTEKGTVSPLDEDYALNLRLAHAGCTFAVVKDVCYGHRMHADSLNAGKPLQTREADVVLLSLYADDMSGVDPERYRRRMAGLYDGIAVGRAEGGDLAGARRAIAQLRGLQRPWQVRAKMLVLALLRRRYAGFMRRVRPGDEQLTNPPAIPPQSG